MKKLFSSIIILALLCITLVGCGSSNTDAPSDTESAATRQEEASTQAAAVEEATSKDLSKQDPYTVKIMLPGKYNEETCNEVAELATAITEPKLNTKIEIMRSDFGTYDQDVNLMLASGEKLDMLYLGSGRLTSSVNNGQFTEIGQYFDEYAPEMKAQVNDLDWSCVTVNGGIYAVPANKEKAYAWGFVADKKIADSVGVDYAGIDSEEELAPLLKAIKEKYPDIAPLSSNGGSMDTMTTYDSLGDGFGVLEDCTDANNTKIVNWYASDTYRKILERRYRWVQEGLISPDAVTITDSWADLVMAGKAYSRFTNYKPGIKEEIEKRTQGIEVVVLPMTKSYTTSSSLDILWSVAHNSEKPERTVQMMNEIYTNSELQNILINGVEGKHWEYKNAEKTLIGYPVDMAADTATSYRSYTWAWMNQMITPVWEPSKDTLWKETEEYNKSAIPSPAKGFIWLNESVMNEVTTCNNVVAKYKNALECGSVDPAVGLPKFLKELEDAGINRIIEEKQKQFDAWLANK